MHAKKCITLQNAFIISTLLIKIFFCITLDSPTVISQFKVLHISLFRSLLQKQ